MADRIVVRTVGILAHPDRPAATAAAVRLCEAFAAAGIAVTVPRWAGEEDMGVAARIDEERFDTDCDLVVTVGGDGTCLRACSGAPAGPLVGGTCGARGARAAVLVGAVAEPARRVAAGDVRVGERLLLEVRTAGGAPALALNDVHFGKPLAGRVVKLETGIDGLPFVTYLVDGLVVATPTGSTAYNFSARGPLVDPGVAAFVLTPVAPHMLWDRSLVLPTDSTVSVRAVGDRPVSLACDGRVLGELPAGATAEVRVAQRRARLVRWRTEGFAARVRDKFGLDRPRGI